MKYLICVVFIFSICQPYASVAEDWPMWRHDAGRSGVAETSLPDSLKLHWVRELSPLTPAFHSERLQFDAGHEPVISQGQLLLASSQTDSITSYDARSGKMLWRFQTNGPVRFAPAIWNDSVCFGSDDGYLYCVSLSSGELRWKLQAAPSNRMVLGNRRLISMWPVRGGPVVSDGHVYFAAGVWPFEGVFVYSVDIESGQVRWRNDRLGYLYGTQPHNTQAIGGLAPQGYLVVNGEELIVPCSTAYPARLNRKTGKLIEFELPSPGRFPGGWFAAIDPATAKALRRGQLTFDDVVNRQEHEDKVHKGTGSEGVSRKIIAGSRTFNFDDPIDSIDSVNKIEGPVHSMAVADGRLFVTTRAGMLYCFGDASSSPNAPQRWTKPNRQLTITEQARQHAQELMSAASSRHGLAVIVGLEDGSLTKSLLSESSYQVVAIDDNIKRVQKLRSELTTAGLYGSRAAVIHGDPNQLQLPPYLATVLTTERRPFSGRIPPSVLQSIRPFGGIAAFGLTKEEIKQTNLQRLSPGNFAGDKMGDRFVIRRVGRLPGSTDYAGGWKPNSDELVSFPLGVLWFDDTVAHFKRSPQPQFKDGVMISQPKDWHAVRKKGDYSIDYPLLPHVLSDIYTGRVFADEEETALRLTLEDYDIDDREPSQYRPPQQRNAWKPEQPIAGTRTNPLTGETEPRAFPKTYGCDGGLDYGTIYTMRSGTPAYYDKTLESGTVFLSGPRSGCTNSVIPSGGLMNVPYFYEGCTCSYPLPTAMALVTMPESHEQWSSWGQADIKPNSIRRIGLNFGAPGDRMTRSGTLWLDYPPVGGPSPSINVKQSPESTSTQYKHSLWVHSDEAPAWVAGSSITGLRKLSLHDVQQGRYTVKLVFAELNESASNKCIQQVSLQGRIVLPNLDVRSESAGALRSITKEWRDVEIDGTLELGLKAIKGETHISGVELIPN